MADLETANDSDLTQERRSADESSEDSLSSGFRTGQLQLGRSPGIPYSLSNKYYFHDGNVDIRTVDNVVFRVHQGVLSFHSPHFESLLTSGAHLWQDGRIGASYPTLHVHETELEVKWALEIMYNGADSNVLKMRNEMSVEQLDHMFRVGHKYGIRHLQKAARRRLHILFPNASLEQWKPFSECKQSARILPCTGAGRERLAELIAILALIRDFPEMRNLKPMVLYVCCQLSIEGLVTEHHEFGLTVALFAQDKLACLRAIPQLLARKFEIFNALTSGGSNCGCSRYQPCNEALLALVRDIMQEGVASQPCPLDDITPWCENQVSWGRVCTDCRMKIKAEIQRLRLAVWNDLGTIFNVSINDQ